MSSLHLSNISPQPPGLCTQDANLHFSPVPLANAGAAGIGQDDAAHIPQDLCLQREREGNHRAGRWQLEGSGAAWGPGAAPGTCTSPCLQGCGPSRPEATLLSSGVGGGGTHVTIPLNGGSDLLRARCDGKLGLALESVSQCLLGHGC